MWSGAAAAPGVPTSCGAATWSGGARAQMEKTSTGLTAEAEYYAYSVIVSGGVVFALTFRSSSPNPRNFLIYFALALIASVVKFRLPGISGTYSASFLVTLIGMIGFTLLATKCYIEKPISRITINRTSKPRLRFSSQRV